MAVNKNIQRLNEIIAVIREDKQITSEQIDHIKGRIVVVGNGISTKRDRVLSINEDIAQLTTDIQNLQDNGGSAEDVQELKDQKAAKESTKSVIKGKIRVLQEDYIDLKLQLANRKSRMDSLIERLRYVKAKKYSYTKTRTSSNYKFVTYILNAIDDIEAVKENLKQ